MVMAYVQLRAGNNDEAFDHLETVLSIPSDYSAAWVEADPIWKEVRDHPRYKEIIATYRDITF